MAKLWKSIEDKAGSARVDSIKQREFSEGASVLEDGVDRRSFMKMLGGTAAFAGLTGCKIRKPYQKIRPYSDKVEFNIPGQPLFFATSYQIGQDVLGLVVETHEGRPTKVEGNPLHPGSLGATSGFHQASVLDLYDPNRLKDVQYVGESKSFDQFQDWFMSLRKKLKSSSGKGLYVLTPHQSSPTFYRMVDNLRKVYPEIKFFRYEPVNSDHVVKALHDITGKYLRAEVNYLKSDLVVSFDSDFLGQANGSVSSVKAFSKRRDPDSDLNMNRLYAFESAMSVTGAKADHRFPLKSGHVQNVLYFLIKELFRLKGYTKFDNLVKAQDMSFDEPFIDSNIISIVAKDLLAHSGKSAVIAGDHLSVEVHKLVFLLNDILGNNAVTVSYSELNFSSYDFIQQSSIDAISELNSDLNNDFVDALIILGGDPVYSAPADLAFSKSIVKAKECIYLSELYTKTAKSCNWVVPKNHYLESWGDLMSANGTVSVVQPMIKRMYHSLTDVELLQLLVGVYQTDYSLLRQSVKRYYGGGNFESFWKKSLHNGIFTSRQSKSIYPSIKGTFFVELLSDSSDHLELVFTEDYSVYDGRFINNGWLQEFPDTITKLTWDNALLIAPYTAKKLKLKSNDVVKLIVDDVEQECPVFISPGQAENSLALSIGYGQDIQGDIGKDVGVDAYKFRTTQFYNINPKVTLVKTNTTYELASTQDHGSMEGRPLVRYADKDYYEKHPHFADEMVEVPSDKAIWKDHSYDEGYQWGMSIDLSKCTGCNACTIACQAENNIPIVGKEQVLNGREMHWIRMDRYYEGDERNPKVLEQPVACMHCENAPCEQVCPVAATVHDDEGLNVMVYNRCVGTRYCSDNCPVKVRRFNFFDYNQRNPHATKKDKFHLFDYVKEPAKMMQQQFNPDVTVRMRGIMEKCTYCIQRISFARQQASNENRLIEDGEVKVACQQVCPADGIAFGNILDPESKVAKMKKRNRVYELLGGLLLKARTTYLAAIRNPNPELAYLDKTAKEDVHGH
ncbi:molybdopterin oxidoreductase [Candidatus Marinamargulisbacteria bacterium SCGC AG-414-C22]|nr:molybdopterin oxidoreductase [Candidatus Marinamargulisbacteria bacterium SCGC AG-414-C22]